jgi:hypothetical protein
MFPPAPRSFWLCAAAAAALVAAVTSPGPAAAQRIGVSSAVNPATTGAPPGQADKTLLVGENIVFNEHINTGPDGQTQILFVDESAMSIGPNSDMTIDEFVYNPKTGTGTEALSATRGVFRYVGGKLSKGETPVTIRTPVATIGIRGGVFVMNLDAGGKLDVVFLYGKGLTVTGLNGVTETITRPGFGVFVNGRGAAPSSPAPAPRGTLSSFITQLDGHSGSSGGASQVPTDTTVANSGVQQTVSGNLPASVQAAIQSQASQTQTQTQTPTTSNSAQNNLNTTESQSQPQIVQSDSNGGAPQVVTIPPGGTLSGGATGINTANHQSGFTNQITPFSGGSINNGVFVAAIGAGSLSLSLSQGTGTLYTPSGASAVTGTPFVTADGTFFYSNLALVGDPSKIGVVYGGRPVPNSVFGGNSALNVATFQIQRDAALQSAIPFTTNQTGGQIPNPSVSPIYVAVPAGFSFSNGAVQGTAPTFLQASLGINGTGSGQSSALVVAVGNAIVTNNNPGQTTAQLAGSGNAEGTYRPNGTTPQTLTSTSFLTGIDGTGNSFYGNNHTVEGFVLTPNRCCNPDGSQIPQLATATNTATDTSSTYGFVQPAVAVQAPAIASGPQTAQTLSGLIGGTMVGTVNGSAVPYAVQGGIEITTNPSTMQIASVIAGVDPFTSSQSDVNSFSYAYGAVSGQTSGTTNQGYINDNLFAALQAPGGVGSSVNGNSATSANLYMVNANAVPNNPLLPSTGLCQCQYLQWGYWGGEVDTGTGSGARSDIAQINTWAAGVQTPAADIANLTSLRATANYTGNALGTVNNNGAGYLASGIFSETYHFGSFTGNLAINNFDGNSFSASITGGPRAPSYVGSLSSTNSNLSGTASGLFFGPSAAETGGSFAVHSISGLPYQAAGVFGGKKTGN